MALCLRLTVRFFCDRYHGSDWPPSPGRLFQALVAGAKTGAAIREWNENHECALRWLEGLGPPEILARSKSDAKSYTLYVPNNSLDGTESTKTSKQVRPKILRGHVPGEADVIYQWRVEDGGAARLHLQALDRTAARLRALGWGVDFAAATASLDHDESMPGGLELFTPGAGGGTALRVPAEGLLDHLDERHHAFTMRISRKGIDPYTRPTLFGQARYQRAHAWQPRRHIEFELETPDGDTFAGRWENTQTVAAWLRHAAGRALLQEELDEAWVNSFVLGHTAPDDLGRRLSFVPLPSIGHAHSDGGIRRVLIAEPPDAAGAESEALDLLRIKLAGTALGESDRVPRAVLVPVGDRNKVLPFFLRRSRVWETVTPVILHGHNAARGRISLAKTERLLRQAFEAAGFPEPLLGELAFQRAPYWAGCEAANDIRVPRHLATWPRMHVRVEFNEPVEGPVLAGIGRHYGIGVFAARRDD